MTEGSNNTQEQAPTIAKEGIPGNKLVGMIHLTSDEDEDMLFEDAEEIQGEENEEITSLQSKAGDGLVPTSRAMTPSTRTKAIAVTRKAQDSQGAP